MTIQTRRPLWRAAVGALAGALAISGSVTAASPAGAVEGFAFDRFQGQDRYITAAEIATSSFSRSARVVLASGEERNFPDALTGNYLAGFADAPILLTRTSSLPAETAQALRDLQATRVTIIGGTSAVSAEVQRQLSSDYTVDRIAGEDRYDTAARVGVSIPKSYVGSVDARRTAILGNGQNFPDILAASPASFEAALPITLTRPDSLPADTENELRSLEIQQVVIVGGTTAVSTAVENRVREIVGSVRRIAGTGRYETARDFANFELEELGFVDTHVNLARGDRFPDALAGGPHAGRDRSPLILTPPTTLAAPAEAFLEANDCALTRGHIFGGTSAVSTTVENRAEQVAGTCEDAPQPQPAAFSVTPDTTLTLTCVANPDTNTGDDRVYTVSGLEQDVEYRVTLLEASTVSGAGTQSDPVRFTDTDNDNLAEIGNTTADITSVNSAAPQNNTGDGTTRTNNDVNSSRTAVFTARGDGTATLTVDGSAAGESFRPVVYVNGGPNNADDDGGQSPRLELNDDNTAAEAFDLGGVTTCSGSSTTASTTQRPELVTASIVSTSSAPSTGTAVRFTFDEAVTIADLADFQLYYEDGTVADAAGDAGTVEGNSVVVSFFDVNEDAEALRLTVATVDFGAVLDSEGRGNPEGDAAIGTAGSGETVETAGITVAPDLIRVSNFRQSATAGTTAVDFTFDEAAFYTGQPDGFKLVMLDGQEQEGQPPAPESRTPSGTGEPGGNGTTTITVLFANLDGPDDNDANPATSEDGDPFDPPFTETNVARGTVDRATVADAAQTGFGEVGGTSTTGTPTNDIENGANVNPLQAAAVANSGNSSEPDLVSIELRPNADATRGDAALYVFDQPVTLDFDGDAVASEPAPENFGLYKMDATTIFGDSAQVNPNDRRQVLVQFSEPDATVNTVGGNVLSGTVFAANPDGTATSMLRPVANEQDEEGISSTSGNIDVRAPGRTFDPDLTSVALSRPTTTDVFGNQTQGEFQATYTFDEAVATTPVANRFFLYLADGTRLIGTTCATGTTTSGTGQNNNTVTCTGYRVDADNDGIVDSNEPVATSEQRGNATLGTVDNGAVTAFDGGANPEGAEPTTGGTGTRTA